MRSDKPKLSVCIPTFNRAAFIRMALDSIVSQITEECEIVILDGGSTDNTFDVISPYLERGTKLRFIRQDMPMGLDQDRDRVVMLAEGEYCWVVSSKDFLKPGAIESVLKALKDDFSVVMLNMEIRDVSLSKLLVSRSLIFDVDRVYLEGELDRLFNETLSVASHSSCTVIRRDLWLSRERERYYGSLYGHLGVTFQSPIPGKVLVMAQPLVCHRFGSQSWISGSSEMLTKWPTLINSLAISEDSKKKASKLLSVENVRTLLFYRAFGLYSLAAYRRTIHPRLCSNRKRLIPFTAAVLPGSLVNAVLAIYVWLARHHYWAVDMHMLKTSRFHIYNWKILRSLNFTR